MKVYGVLFLVLLAVMSCSKKLPTAPPAVVPEELSFQCEKLPLANGEYSVLQTISLKTSTESGNLFAYKIYTSNEELPAGLFANPEGWLYFYTPGADHSISIEIPGNHRSIWTTQRNLSVEFSSSGGKLSQIITQVDVQIRHADQSIRAISSPFRSDRLLGSTIIVNFQDGDTVSAGVEFLLREQIGDIFVEGLYADHFMYRVNTLNSSLQVTTFGTWHNSLSCEDIRKVILNTTSSPALTANLDGEYTQFESYVVSRQGLIGASTPNVYFHVQTGFYPQTLIYSQKTVGLGSNHFSIDPALLPYTLELIPSSSSHKNRVLYPDNQNLQAINSPDFKLHLNWGWSGQYGYIASGIIHITDDPWLSEINQCVDVNGNDYHSRIIAFDLRWDNGIFPIQDHFFNSRIITDQGTGTQWLRIDNVDVNSRYAILSNLTNGSHRLQVRAVDLQNAIDPTPAEQYYDLVASKPFNQRSGILIVDDSPNSPSMAPEAYVDDFYSAVVPQNLGNVELLDLNSTGSIASRVNPVMLQNYKMVLWHSDNPQSASTLSSNPDALLQYLSNSGKLVFSGTHLTVVTMQQISLYPELMAYFGLSNSGVYSSLTSSGIQNNTFFVNAIGTFPNFGNINVNITDSFNVIVRTRLGLSAITYFEPSPGLDFVYAFGCKAVNSPYAPTQEQYNLYSSKYVAYMRQQGTGSVLVFGFPLSYMVQTDVATALPEVFAQLLNPNVVK
ncbi:MAG: hypothetical protein CVU48_07625 [Candidatus Cloacimonetes bacterium HGW-Cloacimonetes-1]|jgi:hypothetical protein|nr:MAG: hypothetical protein CVU48_07625 [Candidatus Cloacimonetes bacterium HGW-Cloacimonetes-1]